MIESKLEKEFGWDKIMDFNIQIGKFIAEIPEISYRIADRDGNYCIEFHSQKDAEKYYDENKHYKRFFYYSVQKHEQYPFYDQNWNELMKAVAFLHESNVQVIISHEIDVTYKRVLDQVL